MKKLVVALLIIWLGAGAAATYLWRQLDALRGENIALQSRMTTLKARRPIAAATSPQAARPDIPAPPADPAPTFAVANATSSQDYEDFRRSMARATLPQLYPDLDKALGLTSEELDKFEALLTRQITSPTFGRSPDDQKEVATLLGDRYPQWQAYQESLPGRRQVSQLRGQLAASGSTLSDVQAQSLMAALNAELKRAEQDRRGPPLPAPLSPQETRARALQRAADNNSRSVLAAAPILNPQQLDSYRQMLDQQLRMGRLGLDVIGATQSPSATHK
jgi:hypothetical protein